MKVLIADKFESAGVEGLRSAGFDVEYTPGLSGAALLSALETTRSEVLVVRSTKVQADVIDKCTALRLIVRAGSGTDTIDVRAATRRKIHVCNCPGQNSAAVAELTLGMMVALDRRIVDETVDLRNHIWNKKEYSKARGLKGRTLGIVGLGRVGVELARRAYSFDMRLLYCDVESRPEIERSLGLKRVELTALLRESDFISLHVPGGDTTRCMIGRAQLAMMKPTAFVLNCSRGGVLDEAALAEAIRAGKLAGAALDVFEIEPGAADTTFNDPIVNVPRVYGTHHVGASTEQAQNAVAEETVRVVRAFRDAGEFLNCVNL